MANKLNVTAAVVALALAALVAAPDRAHAEPRPMGAKAMGTPAAGLASVMSRGAALTGAALSIAGHHDELMPVVVRGTDRRSVSLVLLRHDGALGERQTATLESLMRCRSTGRTHEVSPGLIAILADLAEAFPGRPIEFVSGYRAPPNGAPNSKHFRGHAVDIRIPGVPLTDVRDYLWRSHTSIGLGYYPRQGFVHVDHRPGDPDIAWTAVNSGATYQFHPAWARALRADRERQSRVGL